MKGALRTTHVLHCLILFVVLIVAVTFATAPSAARAAETPRVHLHPNEEPPPECDTSASVGPCCDSSAATVDFDACCVDEPSAAENALPCIGGRPEPCSDGAPTVPGNCQPSCSNRNTTSSASNASASLQCSTTYYAPVVDLPSDPSLLGIWTIGSLSVTVLPTTVLDSRVAAFEPGALVRVDFDANAGGMVASAIRAYWPANPTDPEHWRSGRALGQIDSMPQAAAAGTWTIAGVEYLVDEQTRYVESAAYDAGSSVRVEYLRNSAGERVARTIQPVTGSEMGQHLFVGTVDARPQNTSGAWLVGGVPFVVESSALISEGNGMLVVDAYVSVRYHVAEGRLIASAIKSVVPPGAGEVHDVGRIAALGGAATSSGQIWVVGGHILVVPPETRIDDALSPLEVGQLALVNAYTDANGAIVATSIEGMPPHLQQFLPLVAIQ